MKSKILLSIFSLFFTFSYAFAETNIDKAKVDTETDAEKHAQVIEEYKKFLGAVPPAIRDEVREYRKAVTRINKEKTNLYKKLSQEAQDFLSKERQFKMKLPLKDSRTIAAEKDQM